ncbi:DUF523 domain-containing protein [Anaerovorax odorimutans]|uniref:DUF523 domain-containing protein n=1 Tax=Anaerovorax odorimutans TaxID=109327 RepID=A0ABT1RQK9_9FIRM|nr:DUF523 domain-containing protein [Anaerovorax odorimutans]MCQ4637181.1 DUF523 domain-containing protein [Anaerovorax odorimutans]
MYIISACLLGENCKYNGGNNRCQWVVDFARTHSHIPVCPETQAGLPAPRPPAEIRGSKVVDSEGKDLTEAFDRGARACYELAKKAAADAGEPIEGAILKAKSPSCGKGRIYDGTFSDRLTKGDGYLARLLKKDQIDIITEKENPEND